ncbi:MAG: transketolase [Christensenellaceae bacterium]|nr:transketolase [Christensenellaceae bacterium]
MEAKEKVFLNDVCKQLRKDILDAIVVPGVGHVGGSMSIVEVLAVLYYKQMNVEPKNPQMADRDRLVLSKGHAGPALYAVLAEKGYFPREMLKTLNTPGTNLPSHADMLRTPGIDMTAGSLGQGLSAAVGMAIGAKIAGSPATIYAIIGDGESQEGQIWEAAMYANQKKLDNLIAITDYNNAQISGTVDDVCTLEPITDKWEAFGFKTIVVKDGHDVEELDNALTEAKKADKPVMIIMHTVKGKGISWAEEAGYGCHSMNVNADMVAAAQEDLK